MREHSGCESVASSNNKHAFVNNLLSRYPVWHLICLVLINQKRPKRPIPEVPLYPARLSTSKQNHVIYMLKRHRIKLALWHRFLLGKLVISQLVEIFIYFHVTKSLISMLIKSLSYGSLIQSIPYNSVSLKFILKHIGCHRHIYQLLQN